MESWIFATPIKGSTGVAYLQNNHNSINNSADQTDVI